MASIAFQGVAGAYSHLACQSVFPEHSVIPCESFVQAFAMVENGLADLAMIPVENSTAGRVEEIYRQIPKTHLHIVAEHFAPVNHCLLVNPGVQAEDLTWVGSHPQALAQCAQHIEQMGIKAIAQLDTAGAAQLIRDTGSTEGAAIASSLAAQLYGLTILRHEFNDVKGNTTRFIILARDANAPVWQKNQFYISSYIFKVRNIPAALYKALGGFATNGINLIKIESYMDGGTLNSSRFHIDIAAHPDDPATKHALAELNFFAENVRWLGTYAQHEFRRQHDYV